MIGALVAAATLAASNPAAPRLLAATGGAIVRATPDGAGARKLVAGADAAWSPDGTLLVFVRGGDLWTANADGSGARRIVETPNVPEAEPAWSPNGREIAYTTGGDGARHVWLVHPDGTAAHRITGSSGEEWSPAWSPDGRRLAFVSSRLGAPAIFLARADGTGVAQLAGPAPPAPAPDEPAPPARTDVRDLDWAPDGRTVAYTAAFDDGTSAIDVQPLGAAPASLSASPSHDEHPVWSPDGSRLAFDTVTADGTRALRLIAATGGEPASIGRGVPLDWRAVPLARPLYPDLVQRPPSGLEITESRGHFLLGFTSLVDNRGPGILWIRARRPPSSPVMDASQLVQLAGGGAWTIPGAGQLHYTVAPPHYHWHLLHFERYELRRTGDFRLLVRDRKSGFCIADHYGIAVGIPHGPPRFLGNCGQFQPQLREVEEGSSVGYTDRYPANFHGQNLDVTHVPAGTYWLVHRANSDHHLREENYGNDVASLLIRLAWPGGHGAPPRVEPLRTCLRERCP